MRKKRSPKSWMTFFVRKLCLFLVTMIGITFLSFCLTYFSPSDPAEMMYQAQGIVPTDEMLAVTRERMGLNRPMLVQYGSWLLDLGRGNMGTSIKSGNPVLQDMLKVLPNTLYLNTAFHGFDSRYFYSNRCAVRQVQRWQARQYCPCGDVFVCVAAILLPGAGADVCVLHRVQSAAGHRYVGAGGNYPARYGALPDAFFLVYQTGACHCTAGAEQ